MDPITALLTALSLGAAAGAHDTAKDAICDAYSGLKMLIRNRFVDVNVDLLDQNPASEARQAVIKEDLVRVGADRNDEVVEHARALLEMIRHNEAEIVSAVGLKIEDLESASLTLGNISVYGRGIGAHISRSTVNGPVTIGDTAIGQTGEDFSKKK